MRVTRHHGVRVFASDLQEAAAQVIEVFAKSEEVAACVVTDFRCKHVVARTGRVLLSADFKGRALNQIAFEVEVQVFNVRNNFKFRMRLHAGDILRHLQNLFGDILGDNALLSQHKDVSFVDIKQSLIRTFQISRNGRSNQVIHQFFGRCFFHFSALNRHFCLLKRCLTNTQLYY